MAYLEDTAVLCVDMQGLHPLEHYVLSKYFYFLCILYQRTRMVAEGMLEALVIELAGEGKLPGYTELRESLGSPEFCSFDDAYVWTALRAAATNGQLSPDVRDAAAALIERKLPKVTWEFHPTYDPGQGPPADVQYGPEDGPWNQTIRAGVERAARPSPSFCVLEKRVRPGMPAEQVLVQESQPIRVLVRDVHQVPEETPGLDARDAEGNAIGRVVLLESLKDSIVSRLAGCKTHILRRYRAHEV